MWEKKMTDKKIIDIYFMLQRNWLKTCESFLPDGYYYDGSHESKSHLGERHIWIRGVTDLDRDTDLDPETGKYFDIPLEEFTDRFHTIFILEEFNTKFDLVSKDWSE
jgi:hypothetical protein